MQTGFREPRMPETGAEKPRLPVLCVFVLCCTLVYTGLAWLHRTNSPAIQLQQPVAPRNKSSQHVCLCPSRRQQDHGVVLLRPPSTDMLVAGLATVSFRE